MTGTITLGTTTVTIAQAPAATACKAHPAFEADNCPSCGTSRMSR